MPTYSEFIDQQLTIEPLTGPVQPINYTKRFPDAVYHKAPESHLMRFLYALLGPAGAGWLRKQTYENRLLAESAGLELFDLDAFYGNPFGFGRITEEYYSEDPLGVLTRDEWDVIRVKDEAYRSRAIDFMNGARAGNTPLGMKLVARSGLGHEAEIIENYKYLFDVHSDDPIGVPYYGTSTSLEEFIVLPRQETPRNEEQTISITGNPAGGNFVLWFNGYSTSTIPYNADMLDVEAALSALPIIGADAVRVRGGPGPNNDFVVRFVGHLSATDVPEMTVQASFPGTSATATVTTTFSGGSFEDEIYHVPARHKHNLQTALDRIRPVATYPTVGTSIGRRQRQTWTSSFASSEYNEVIRYVTGQPAIQWQTDDIHWIERNKEKEAPRVAKDLQYHYTGFHNITATTAYDENDTVSEHVGRFSDQQRLLPGYTHLENTDDTLRFSADRVLADYFEPLTVATQTASSAALINGIYPSDYLDNPNVPAIKYNDEQFWASTERSEGVDYLEFDFGEVRAVNFVSMEIANKPLGIAIEYDVLDQAPQKEFLEVTPVGSFPSSIDYEGGLNPWTTSEFRFTNSLGRIIFTRFIRVRFEREQNTLNPFLYNTTTQVQSPWSVDVRNLRLGRSVSDF